MEQRASENDVSLSVRSKLRPKFIVSTFIDSALTGDVSKIAQTFPALDRPGAWREAFTRLLAAGAVDPSIPPAFVENCRRVKTETRAKVDIHLGMH